MPTGPAYVVLRIRPSTSPGGGLLAEHVHRIGLILTGITADEVHGEIEDPVEFNTQNVDASLPLVEDKLRRVLQVSDTVVLDLWFDATKIRPAAVRQMLAAAIQNTCCPVARRAGKHALRDTHQVLILCENRLQRSDPLVRAVRRSDPSGRIAVVDGTQQRVIEPSWPLTDEVVELARLTDDDLRREVDARMIRRRGVFASAGDDGSYHPFHFTPELCLPRITELLRRQFARLEPSAVLYDDLANPWLEEVVLAACTDHKPHAARFSDLAFMPDDLHNVRDSKKDLHEPRKRKAVWRALRKKQPPPQLLLVVPLFLSGERVSDALSRLDEHLAAHGGETFAGSASALAVMVDRSRLDSDGHCTYRPTNVDYLVTVTQHVLRDDDWRLVAARVAGEPERFDAPWTTPSLIGFWSLISEVGSDVETPVPPSPQGRKPHSLYPKFRDMSSEDALWLAECVLRVAEREVGCKRAQMLVVLPAEEVATGAGPLGQAIDKRLDVEVLRVPRKEITDRVASDSTRARLREYRGSAIVIVDESTVSHGTIKDLGQIIREEVGKGPKLAVVGVELPDDSVRDRPPRMHSLFGWQPT